MSVAIMQPYIFPYVGYYQLVNSVDSFVFYDDVNYIKGGWINRNRIIVNNEPNYINLIVKNASRNSLIKDVRVELNNAKVLKTIELSYKKAVNFDVVFPLIQEVLLMKSDFLVDYCMESVMKIGEFLGIITNFSQSSIDFPETIELGREDRLIHITKKMKSEHYINAISGQMLYDKVVFKEKGVNLLFLKPSQDIIYNQFNSKQFHPWLSIIDVLMNCEKEYVKTMLSSYELV